jgi:hypothetical protein
MAAPAPRGIGGPNHATIGGSHHICASTGTFKRGAKARGNDRTHNVRDIQVGCSRAAGHKGPHRNGVREWR